MMSNIDVEVIAETNVVGYAIKSWKSFKYRVVDVKNAIPSTVRTLVTTYRSSAGIVGRGTTQTDKNTYRVEIIKCEMKVDRS